MKTHDLPTPQDLVKAALQLAAREWLVFPVRGKEPLRGSRGFKDASVDEKTIRSLFNGEADGVAVATGALSGFVVIDVDNKRGADGREELRRLKEELGQLPPTLSVHTPSGGRHYYFRLPSGQYVKSAVAIAKGIDVRGEGGYVVAPPSPGYRWAPRRTMAELPESWLLFLQSKRQVVMGERNVTLTKEAGKLRRNGKEAEEIFDSLLEFNGQQCQPPLPTNEVRKIAESVARYEPAQEEKVSQADMVVALANEHFLFVNSDEGDILAASKEQPHILWSLDSKKAGFRSRIASSYYKAHGKVPQDASLSNAFSVLEGGALEAPAVKVGLRIVREGGTLYYDLGDESAQVVRVTDKGWEVVSRPPDGVQFRRTQLTAPQVVPQAGGGVGDLLRALPEAPARDVLLGWLVATFFPEIAHPILLLTGPQGSGKTTAARLVAGLVDPSPDSAAVSGGAPRTDRDWAVTARASYVLGLDNISHLPRDLAEALCRAATGESHIARALYTDKELSLLNFRRCVMLTSIYPGLLRGDLAERLVPIELDPISPSTRKLETELLGSFEVAKPRVLGALFNLVADVLSVIDDIQPDELSRMADFDRVLAALDKILGTDTRFQYHQLGNDLSEEVVEGDLVAAAIRQVLTTSKRPWKGTTTQLLQVLSPYQPPSGKWGAWPQSPQALTGRLKTLAPDLRKVGIHVKYEGKRGKERRRYWKLKLMEDRDGD